MKQVNRYPRVVAVLILLVMVLLAACQSAPIVKATSFDYEAAADASAARWIAMAEYYAEHDLLNDTFDYKAAADNSAARWQAMAEYYAKHDLLNDTGIDTQIEANHDK